MTPERPAHPASYRDPAGHVFRSDGIFYRQVNGSYAAHYDLLIQSGLYKTLADKGLLIAHTEIDKPAGSGAYKILHPKQIPFISYPAEWSPRQLKAAALLTLRIMQESVTHGMILKDATPLNIQFSDGVPLFIDTLSFEKYDPGIPWIAYRQFCENFLFPLYINRYLATGTHTLFNAWPDGISASATASLLPRKSRFNLGVWLHVLLQRNIQARKSQALPAAELRPVFSQQKLIHLLRNLQEIIEGLDTRGEGKSVWSDYYASTILSRQYLDAKAILFREFLTGIPPATALDLGANDGYFSKIMAEQMAFVIAADFDWRCIDRLARIVDDEKIRNILPLCIDITHPTPAAGFCNAEQSSFITRARSPLVTALALIHHLAIGKNIPLSNLAAFFSDITTDTLIIEFVPLEDEKVKQLLCNRDQYHKPYNEAAFETAFGHYFTTLRTARIKDTARTLYLLKKIQ